jgi:hypothetical protein
MLLKVGTIFPEVPNWWYHYYASGYGSRIGSPRDVDFILSKKKWTPDFAELTYQCDICRPQIGATVVAGKSVVIVKTSIGMTHPNPGNLMSTPFIVGYFRVANLKDGVVSMDPEDSLLLLSNPIKINLEAAQSYLPNKAPEYWKDTSRSFAAKIGSSTRNRRIGVREAELIISELRRRYEEGSENYLGPKYRNLLRRGRLDSF